MSGDSIEQFSTLLFAELEAEQKRSAEEVTQLEYQFASRGTFQSGMRLVSTAECLSKGVVRYRKSIPATTTT
jgi:hypothetical protein